MITQTMFNSKFYRFLPVVFLIIGIIEFFSFGGQSYLSLNALKDNYQSIIVFANNHF
ncbi:TVP38/TMEM64 family protein, partial [Francisella tularensis subsp. holarctica]|nr:TVP38/TMEM64 family protein [Francisella tularensis subsp. holarctica]